MVVDTVGITTQLLASEVYIYDQFFVLDVSVMTLFVMA